MIFVARIIDKYSKKELEAIVAQSNSMSEFICNLGYKTSKGLNYSRVKQRLEELGIKPPVRSIDQNIKYSDQELFKEMSMASPQTIRRRFLKLGGKIQCAACGCGDQWNGAPLSLQLDHIDGNNKNNTLNNLRWLCPNCHSQTKTYAGKNTKPHSFKKFYYCKDCGAEISPQAERCTHCSQISFYKVPHPSKEELLQSITENNGNFSAVGRLHGVTDNTVRKWCKKCGLPSHSSDYKLDD